MLLLNLRALHVEQRERIRGCTCIHQLSRVRAPLFLLPKCVFVIFLGEISENNEDNYMWGKPFENVGKINISQDSKSGINFFLRQINRLPTNYGIMYRMVRCRYKHETTTCTRISLSCVSNALQVRTRVSAIDACAIT